MVIEFHVPSLLKFKPIGNRISEHWFRLIDLEAIQRYSFQAPDVQSVLAKFMKLFLRIYINYIDLFNFICFTILHIILYVLCKAKIKSK